MINVETLAQHCHAQIEGGNAQEWITSAADIIHAQPQQVTQLTNPRYAQYVENSQASACFVSEHFVIQHPIPNTLAILRCADPEMAFIQAVELLHPKQTYDVYISPQAVIGSKVSLAKSITIEPYAIISDGVSIDENTQILAGAYIGRNVEIGKNCCIHPYAVIYDNCIIGDHVTIHAGAVIGADGFGYKFRNHVHVKVPQVGNVIIEDYVEIGANTCVDRGALGSTFIGAGSKIDNLVQIGHNNKIGKNVIMCGQTGVSGSCHIGDYAILAGSSGIADHVTIGKGAVVMARAGVANDIPDNTHVFGSPAKEKRVAYKEEIAISKLPALLKTISILEERVAQLEKNG